MIKRLEDRIFQHLTSQERAVSSAELAREFMNLAGGTSAAAAQVLDAVLRQDPRFHLTAAGWTARRAQTTWGSLAELPWFVFTADTRTVENHLLRLLAVHEFPSLDTPPRLTVLMVGPEAAAHAAREELRPILDPPPSHMTVIRALRYLDELFRTKGIFVHGFSRQGLSWFLQESENTGSALPEAFFSAADLIRLIQPGTEAGKLDNFLHFGRVTIRRESPFLTELDAWPPGLPALRQELAMAGIERLDELQAAAADLRQPFDFSACDFTARDLEEVPAVVGVYFLKNSRHEVIYVGKSVNLNRRLGSYFRRQEESDPKVKRIQAETRQFSVIRCGSDLEALLEEARFIEQHRPSINIQLEIHETPAEKRLADPLLVLLPNVDPQYINLFVLEPSGRIFRRPISLAAPESEPLDTVLAGVTGETGAPSAGISGYPPHLAPLALRWLRKNSQRLTFFKPDDYPDRAALQRAIVDGIRNFDNNEKNIFV